MLQGSVVNEMYQVKQETTVSNLVLEFSVVIVHDFRDHQLCISNHNSPNKFTLTNLKRTLLRALQYKECLTEVCQTKRTR